MPPAHGALLRHPAPRWSSRTTKVSSMPRALPPAADTYITPTTFNNAAAGLGAGTCAAVDAREKESTCRGLSNNRRRLGIMGAVSLVLGNNQPQPSLLAFARPVADDGVAPLVFDEARDSVVAVARYKSSINGQVQEVEPLCTAVVWTQEGYIFAPAHCFRSSTLSAPSPQGDTPASPSAPLTTGQATSLTAGERFRVSLHQAEYEATVVGLAPQYDLAVLRIQDAPQELMLPCVFGRDRELRIGQTILAVSRSFGTPHTLSAGVLSNVAGNQLQTDATVDEGSALRALCCAKRERELRISRSLFYSRLTHALAVDSDGRLVGMGTHLAGRLGFGLPVDIIARVVPALIAYGECRS